MEKSRAGLKFPINILKSTKLSLESILKDITKMPTSDLNKRDLFSNFALYSKGYHFSITSFDILIFCNILNLEMNFGNLY